MRYLVVLLALLFSSIGYAADPYIFLQDNSFRGRVAYGKVYIDKHMARVDLRQAVEYANGTTESFRYWDHQLEYARTIPGSAETAFTYSGGGFTFAKNTYGVVKFELVQPADGWTTITVTKDKEAKVVTAPTLWHLYLAEPELCREHITPLLEDLNVFMPYAKLGDGILPAVIKQGASPDQLAFMDKVSLLNDLGSDNYDLRKHAYAKLFDMGPTALAFIRDTKYELDKEQGLRLLKLREEIGAASLDYDERLTAWLVEDPWVWGHIYLTDESARSLATLRIKDLTGEDVLKDTDVVSICLTEKKQ
jgi:hypothetical protein